MAKIIYRKNFLKQVIFRVDFENEIILDDARIEIFKKIVAKDFPEKREQKEYSKFFSIGKPVDGQPPIQENIVNERIIHQFVNVAKGKTMSLAEGYILFEATKYKHFTEFSKSVDLIIRAIETYEIANLKRIGLRYINEIALDEKNPLNWHGYINADLTCNVEFNGLKDFKWLKNLSQSILRKGDFKIIFNYGVNNPDFPNELVQKHFILDIDCYTDFLTEAKNLKANSIHMNDLATKLFEASIGKKLKTLMQK